LIQILLFNFFGFPALGFAIFFQLGVGGLVYSLIGHFVLPKA